MTVLETFFSVEATDMGRATAFYVQALGATVAFTSPQWTSLHIAGVRVGLALDPRHSPASVGLHFVVDDLAAARSAVERAGGRVVTASVEVVPGTVISDVEDTEGNTFSLSQR
jgi:predicted enzyme related to lactoylglutathione lyase